MEVNPFIVELVKLGDGFGSVSMKGLTRQEMYTEFKRLADKTRKRKIFQYDNKIKNHKAKVKHND
jgi:hypothetical protein